MVCLINTILVLIIWILCRLLDSLQQTHLNIIHLHDNYIGGLHIELIFGLYIYIIYIYTCVFELVFVCECVQYNEQCGLR